MENLAGEESLVAGESLAATAKNLAGEESLVPAEDVHCPHPLELGTNSKCFFSQLSVDADETQGGLEDTGGAQGGLEDAGWLEDAGGLGRRWRA